MKLLYALASIAGLVAVSAEPNIGFEITNAKDHHVSGGELSFKSGSGPAGWGVNVDEKKTYQSMTGFGAALTESSAVLIQGLPANKKQEVLKNVFGREGARFNYLRVPVTACDYSLADWTFDDGTEDRSLSRFNINYAKKTIIPVIKDIMKINPSTKIMVTPWSAPAWMKTNNNIKGFNKGALKKDMYEVYAQYLVKVVQEFKKQGVPIHTMTLQNEPLFDAPSYPAMFMDRESQAEFINKHLASAFLKHKITTKVYLYDHNWDQLDYPWYILERLTPDAKKIVEGTAFHCYGGKVSEQSRLHDKFPDQEIMMTECSGGEWASDFNNNMMWDMQNIYIEGINHWSTGTIKWNLALDQDHGPIHGGCKNCRGVLTINSKTKKVDYNVDFYAARTFSRHVPVGCKRMEAKSSASEILSTGFICPGGEKVVVVANQANSEATINLDWNGQNARPKVPSKTVAVFKWK